MDGKLIDPAEVGAHGSDSNSFHLPEFLGGHIELPSIHICGDFSLQITKFMVIELAAALILIARCLLGALFGGNLTALAFSLTGGLLSLLVMALAQRSRHLSVYGVSVLGAAAHSAGQILIATILMHSEYIIAYLPYLLLISTACGCATATVAAGVLRALYTAGKMRNG